MPAGLYIDGRLSLGLKSYEEDALGPEAVRIRTHLAAIKHGTIFNLYSGESPFDAKYFDPELRLFRPRTGEGRRNPLAETYVGTTVVGRVTEVGSAVRGFRPGEWVYGHGPICETVTSPAGNWSPLGTLDPEDALCQDPGLFAFTGVRDGRVGVGDQVAVFGLGAIGLIAVQVLKAAGVLGIVAVDPISKRRSLAARFGADLVLDPTAVDAAMAIREAYGTGVDVGIEVSGNYRALRECIRACRQCGRVVTVSYYKGADTGLELGADYFHNRLELIASLPAWKNPPRDTPLWDLHRLEMTVRRMFERGELTSGGIVDPVVSLAEAPEAFEAIYRDPSQAVKLGVRFRYCQKFYENE